MDVIRHKRFKAGSDVDRSSDERTSPVNRGLRAAGNRRNDKQRNLPILGFDSRSSSSGVPVEELFSLELGWRSSKDTFGAPVKKLLADEMSKETELRKRSPGVIAKLMGLDGIPPPMAAYNQPKCSSEGHSQTCISKEKVGRGTYSNCQVTRRSSKDQGEFKDVFEVLETSKKEQSRIPDQGTPIFELTGSEMEFIRQKFLDAKRLSTDDKLRDSREFHDALDALESNRDLLLKFLQQPGPMFARHLHDLQHTGSCSSRGCLTTIEPLDNKKCNYHVSRGNSERVTPKKNSTKSHNNLWGGHSCHSDSSFSGHSSKSSQTVRKDEFEHLPTRIVVLKPNIDKVKNARNIMYQSHSFQECSDLGEFKTVERTNREFKVKKDSLDKEDVSRESREFRNGKTRQMRNEGSTSPMNLTSSSFQGYAGDESSCSSSGIESSEEPVARSVHLKSSSNLNKGYRQSSSHRKESSISREAKKRLTARWRSSRNSEYKGVVSRGSTLADMLASNDKKVTFAHSDAGMTQERFTDKYSNDEKPDKEVGPLGISSNDGWKEHCSLLTRSRSLRALSIGSGSRKTVHRSKGTDKHLISNRKAVKSNFDQRGYLPSQKSTPSKKTSDCLLLSMRESNDMLLPTQVNKNCMNIDSLDNSSYTVTSKEFMAPCSDVDDRISISRSVKDVGDASTTAFSGKPDELELESSEYMSTAGDTCVVDRYNIIQEEEPSVASPAPVHKSVAALESPCSKEADQPSPVSVLDPAFVDDLSSSSECFESISADLQGLRMQLQLLKLESKPFTEVPMLTSSEEDSTEVSSRLPDDKDSFRTWEFSYFLDILTDSGLNDANPGALLATLYSSDCPINPNTFEQLEKKQSCSSSTTRSDRRLLFDRINLGVSEISQQFSDPHPWVRPSKTQNATKWTRKNELRNRLCKFLDTQIVRYDTVEESDWENLGDEIDVIGKEIERLMINELVAKVVIDMI